MNDLSQMVEDTATPPAPAVVRPTSILLDPVRYAQAERVADMMVMSAMWPAHLRGNNDKDVAKANAILVMNIADRQQQDPLMVAQNIYFVGGKPGWSTAYLIGLTRQAGVFTGPIMFDVTGEGEDLKVVARAVMAGSKETVTAEASMKMAKAEGWVKNPKYRSMPDVMLRYRAATFLIRFYCPEVMLGIGGGMGVHEEQEDVHFAAKDITPEAEKTAPKKEPAKAKEPEDAEVVEEKPKPKPKPKAAEKPEPEPKPEPNHDTETGEVKGDGSVADLDMDEGSTNTLDTVIYQVENASSDGEIDQLLEFYQSDLEQIFGQYPDAKSLLDQTVEATKMSLAT